MTCLALLTALGSAGITIRAATAQTMALSEAEVFTVRGVSVDVTAATAAAARQQALAEGQAEALRRMLRRLTRQVDHGGLPAVDADTATFLVQGLEVASEKTSSVRYLAELTVRFKPAEIRSLLRRTGLPFAETASRPVLVLPVLRTTDGLFLWDAGNRWRAVWAALPAQRGLVPMIVPLGDLADIADIDAEQALLGEPGALEAIGTRYDAGSVLVALATLSTGEGGATVLDVAASRPNQPDAVPLLFSFSADTADEVEAVMRRAASETAAGIEEAWLNSHLLRFDSLQRMAVVIPVSGIDQWSDIARRLHSVAEIARVDRRVLRRASVEVEIEYYGDERQLAAALRQRDLELEAPLPSVVPPGVTAAGQAGNQRAPAPLRVLRALGS